MAAVHAAWGQSAPETNIVASVSGSVNHVETRRSGGNDESGLVLQVRPGVVMSSRSGRIRGSLSYFADLQQDTASSEGAELVHNLNAAFTAEAIEQWAFVDVTASASRRAVSAFGVQTSSASTRDDRNQENVASGTLRPYVRGVLGGAVAYTAGVYASATRSQNSALGDVDERGADISLGSRGGGLFGWGLNASQQRTTFLAGRTTVDDRVIASLNLVPDVDWTFTVRAGQESTDVGSLEKRRYDNWGAGLRWVPSPRTSLSADFDERYFGSAWSVALEHRFALSALRLTSSRGASGNGTSGADATGITAYQLLFAQYASIQPDAALRDLLVRSILAVLQLDPNARVPGGSLSNAITLQRRTELGWTYAGLRLTFVLQAFKADTETIDTQAPQLGDGAFAQRGLVASASWRLNPTAAANLSFSHLQTESSGTRAGNDLNTVAVSLGDQIGPRTSVSINARLSRQSGGPDPYRETAIGATLSHRF